MTSNSKLLLDYIHLHASLVSVQDYVVHVTDEFLEFISDGALAIEVWGHRCAGNGRSPWELDALEAKTQTLRDRSVVSRRQTLTSRSPFTNAGRRMFQVERGVSQD